MIKWRYTSGAMFFGAKVELIKNVKFGVKCICGIPWCMVQTIKNQSNVDQDIVMQSTKTNFTKIKYLS